jgi:hypothetical protein
MNSLFWKTEGEIEREVAEYKSKWKEDLSRDGMVEVATGKFEYKGVFYLVKVLRYFTFDKGFTPMGRRICNSHAVVEYPEETRELDALMSELNEVSEFLYHDTLHSRNDKQNIQEQINECHYLAKQDIDNILPTFKEWKLRDKFLQEKAKKILSKYKKLKA